MRPLDQEQDIAALRERARLAEHAVVDLSRRVLESERELARLRGLGQSELELRMLALQLQVERMQKALFGRSSEKRAEPTQPELPATTPPPPATAAPPPPPPPVRGRHAQPALERRVQVHELDAADRACTQCGEALEEWKGQSERSEEITVLERKYVVVEHERRKYRCRCGACIETAEGPRKLIDGGRYSPEFAASVAVAKYADHLPLERQVVQMRRDGLVVESQTLFDQLWAVTRRLRPVYDALCHEVLSGPMAHADETPWRLLSKNPKNLTLWGVANDHAVAYRILDGKSADDAATALGAFCGALMCDGNPVYPKWAREGPSQGRVTIAGCWAHARRRFVEIEKDYPAECGRVLDLIREMYAVEREAVATSDDPQSRLDARRALRDAKTRGIVAELSDLLIELKQTHLPRSTLGEAVSYTTGQWVPLTRFLENPHVPLDNNAAERALRGVVLGRVNHLGSKSRRGVEVAAVLYSVIESCKLVGVNPREFLHAALAARLDDRDAPLPHVFAKTTAAR